MIRVRRAREPEGFDASVRRPGTRWLAAHANGDIPSHWRAALPDLQRAFHERCGYSAMHDLNGTVDHFVPCSRHRSLAYEWTNLRYASHWINASKRDAEGIVDPFDIQDGWFEVILPSLQLVVSDAAPARIRKLLQSTLDRVPIGHDERIIRQRRAWLAEYEKGTISLEGLRRFAPLIAAAVEREAAKATKATTPRRSAPANRPATKTSARRRSSKR